MAIVDLPAAFLHADNNEAVVMFMKGKIALMADYIGIVKSYVDASYAIHIDCDGHTSGMMTLGCGAVSSFFSKQKLSTKNSTEAELISFDDTLPQIYGKF